MKQKGFTLMELLFVIIAILGIIAAVIIPNVDAFIKTASNLTANETATIDESTFAELASKPISSLNLTELEFMVGYCLSRSTHYIGSNEWLDKAIIYQNQIIINECTK